MPQKDLCALGALLTLHPSGYTHLMHFLGLILFALCSFTARAEGLEGRVVGVTDGDTITLLDGNR
jgi:hypothetical protein